MPLKHPEQVLELDSNTCSLLFHTHGKPITPRSTPYSSATSATPIRIRTARSNNLLSKHNSYCNKITSPDTISHASLKLHLLSFLQARSLSSWPDHCCDLWEPGVPRLPRPGRGVKIHL